jgi:selenobiotic family peptide radical SAM maturase
MDIEKIYPKCSNLLEAGLWRSLTDSPELAKNPEQFQKILTNDNKYKQLPDYISDLAQIEWTLFQIRSNPDLIPENISQLTVNPTLSILELKWKRLADMFQTSDVSHVQPEPGDEFLLIWYDPDTGKESVEPAASEELLVLKMIIEDIPAEVIAGAADVPIAAVDEAVERAAQKGLLLVPDTLIKRDPHFFSSGGPVDNQPMEAQVFTLQWHVTQSCDLNCKHCYDRSDRSYPELAEGLRILDEFRSFCRSRYVHGQVTFSGGNPLLYPYFKEIYRAASERGFTVAILGNPAPEAQIKEIVQISHPSFYQVSLEGLQEHNDYIRGPGHFKRVISFLEILKNLNIYSMVMLTLTKDNINQVLPLAEKLRNHTDHFTFNRLSQVGEGANLVLPPRDEYRAFLKDYSEAARTNPVMGLKDNLFNILRYENGMKSTGGCTGFGCGAAFNFLTLLPDGEVHACRKFPSLLGSVHDNSLADIYDSELARKYRSGSASCNSCPIKPSCGGCMASAYSNGLDIFKERDPYCFICRS